MGERKEEWGVLGVGRRDKIEKMYAKGILYKAVRACFPPLSTYAGGDGNVRDREREILRRRTGGGGDECRRKDDGRLKVSNTHPPALFVSVQRPLDDPSGDTPDFSGPNP
ncbi:hypothetical protein Bbelb_124120 [Branchiostoma belcheri]|nr:hypothetical protein Bbelb_124120 [Branchiostoma belcheri]